MPEPIPFSGGHLDRAEPRRNDEAWLGRLLEHDDTRFLPLWRLQVLVREDDPSRLAWATGAVREAAVPETGAVLLGLDGEVAHFAVDVSPLADPDAELGLDGAARFEELRGAAARMRAQDASVAAQARHLIDWHTRHRFCPGCASSTRPVMGGYARRCFECDTEHFPRTDPVAIMLVVRDDRCLLGRQASWPMPLFSALAGYVEPGETLEEAVRREVLEEVGVRVSAVHYQASQPWPFPASLMLGCRGEALDDEIRVDRREIEDARWFTRNQLRSALVKPTAELALPPPLAIAHHLVRAWLDE